MPKKTSRVLVIGDTHCPTMLPEYVDFLVSTYEQWDCDRVVHIGDLVDNCALSFHLKKPQLKDPILEHEKAIKQIKLLTDAFPKVDLLIGNHDALPYRWCAEVGIPEEMMRSMSQIWGLPKGWKVWPRYHQLAIDGVIYQHGDRGRNSAILNSKAEFASVVQGHHHSKMEVVYHANKRTRVFGMQVGCGVDVNHAAMEYGQIYSQKPLIGCGVVLEGITAVCEPMVL